MSTVTDSRRSSITPVADPPILVVGAGPAGLTAADVLVQRGRRVLVVERDIRVGGIAQTVEYDGYRFDIGGHRFFTRVPEVRELWRTTLGADFIERPRLSRIYYDGRFFDYPLRPANALRNLGVFRAAAVLGSYGWSRLRPVHPERSFEDWVRNRFGDRLYRTFFKTYTEKVWGIPCSEISADWAAQRIRGLSLWTAIRAMLLGSARGSIKTLIDRFEYPRLGPGMMWEAFERRIVAHGGTVQLGASATHIWHAGGRVHGAAIRVNGQERELAVSGVISTMPLRELMRVLDPAPPPAVLAAAGSLRYRDFLTVALVVDEPHLFEDQWIYVHDPNVKVGRIQNFRNWSPDMVPPGKNCLGLEYFCQEGDELWRASDSELVELARRELAALDLVPADRVSHGYVVRMPKAYPVYDATYLDALATIRKYLAGLPNLQVAGRNGMHKYNNQDHSMVTALMAAGNLLDGRYDQWEVNVDESYHEGGDESSLSAMLATLAGSQPSVPRRLTGDEPEVGRTS
jgi:protoporphyrinogen oxidase